MHFIRYSFISGSEKNNFYLECTLDRRLVNGDLITRSSYYNLFRKFHFKNFSR